MKFVICSIPIRDYPDPFPPLGVTRILDALEEAGCQDMHFYNLDVVRPTDEQIIQYFKEKNPDVVGISAVVSTSYSYVKKLTHLLKTHFPHIKQVLGGNMAASSEVLMHKCPIDVCVIGVGEVTIVKLYQHWLKYKTIEDNADLRAIKGLVFHENGSSDTLHFTGYPDAVPAEKIRQINYEYLNQFRDVYDYLPEGISRWDFRGDPRSFEPHRQGQRLGSVLTTKGCVARCTFCHRWDKGYKIMGVDGIIDYISELKQKYNVGYIVILDENFGSSVEHADEFIDKIAALDVLWIASGMRTRSAASDVDRLKRMKKAGCVAVYFGIESGSDRILKIMEKGATAEINMKALQAVQAAGLYTVMQLVIGMPGETEQTVSETKSFIEKAIDHFANDYDIQLSTNYAQALPGTPLYEYARTQGLLGSSLDEEEEYLMKISDVDAAEFKHYINVTQSPLVEVMVWRDRIGRAAEKRYYLHRHKKDKNSTRVLPNIYYRGDYFRLLTPQARKWLRINLPDVLTDKIVKLRRCYSRTNNLIDALQIYFDNKKREEILEDKSLRKVMKDVMTEYPQTTLQMLREGR